VNRKEGQKGRSIWFVYASENNEDWKYLGMITSNMLFKLTEKSEWNEGDVISLCFAFLWKKALNEEDAPAGFEMWHNGICSKCGRVLEDENSVALGIGPTCRKNLGI